jgi:hypothetical protein
MPASHWSRSKPVFEMVEAAFAEAVFIGPQFPSDGHTPGWECGYPRAWCRSQANVRHPIT